MGPAWVLAWGLFPRKLPSVLCPRSAARSLLCQRNKVNTTSVLRAACALADPAPTAEGPRVPRRQGPAERPAAPSASVERANWAPDQGPCSVRSRRSTRSCSGPTCPTPTTTRTFPPASTTTPGWRERRLALLRGGCRCRVAALGRGHGPRAAGGGAGADGHGRRRASSAGGPAAPVLASETKKEKNSH